MAIKLSSKPNTVTPGGAYPFGDIKNASAPGSGDGTPVNRMVYADFHQFFEKLMFEAGITHNDLPDNQTNGFQLFKALEAIAGGVWRASGTLIYSGSGAMPTVTFLHTNRYTKVGNTLHVMYSATIIHNQAGSYGFLIGYPAGLSANIVMPRGVEIPSHNTDCSFFLEELGIRCQFGSSYTIGSGSAINLCFTVELKP